MPEAQFFYPSLTTVVIDFDFLAKESLHSLFAAIGRPDLAVDERFATRNARVHHDADLTEIIESWSRSHSADDVVTLLGATPVAVAPVRTPR